MMEIRTRILYNFVNIILYNSARTVIYFTFFHNNSKQMAAKGSYRMRLLLFNCVWRPYWIHNCWLTIRQTQDEASFKSCAGVLITNKQDIFTFHL